MKTSDKNLELAADFLSEIAPSGLKQLDNLFEQWKFDSASKQEVNFNQALPPEMRRKILRDIGLTETIDHDVPSRYYSYIKMLNKILELNIDEIVNLPQEQIVSLIWQEGRSMKLGEYEIQQLTSILPLWLKKISKKCFVELSPVNVFDIATPEEAETPSTASFNGIIGQSDKMLSIFGCLKKISNSNLSILIQGESGTGKELIAHAIHSLSDRAAENFIPVNCGALPDSIIESELFGYEKGAFTGAIAQKKGYFEISHKGTVFLDEITETSLNTQVKLLRVLQEKQFFRVGGVSPVNIDTRVIAATNRNILDMVKEESFRHDLYYRVNEMTVTLPPLRERKSDLPLLINHFLKIFSQQNNRKMPKVSASAQDLLLNYGWPGNIRELENVLKRSVILADQEILPEHLPPILLEPVSINAKSNEINYNENLSLEELVEKAEKSILLKALASNKFNVSKTAEKLKVSRRTLQRKIKQYQIEKT